MGRVEGCTIHHELLTFATTTLVRLADRRLKASQKDLREVWHGRVTDNRRLVLGMHLGQYDSLETPIKQIDRKVDALIQQIDAPNKAQLSDEADAEQDPWKSAPALK